MSKKAHKRLRRLMDDYDLIREDLAEATGKSLSYVSGRITGRLPWDISDCYAICDFFNGIDPEDPPMPYKKIPYFFPRDGIDLGIGKRELVEIRPLPSCASNS